MKEEFIKSLFNTKRAIDATVFAIVHPKQFLSWRKARKAYIKEYPACELCTHHKKLNVHHIRPRHLFPELVLAWENFITLCRACHYRYGHCAKSWKDYDSTVTLLKRILENYRSLTVEEREEQLEGKERI